MPALIKLNSWSLGYISSVASTLMMGMAHLQEHGRTHERIPFRPVHIPQFGLLRDSPTSSQHKLFCIRGALFRKKIKIELFKDSLQIKWQALIVEWGWPNSWKMEAFECQKTWDRKGCVNTVFSTPRNWQAGTASPWHCQVLLVRPQSASVCGQAGGEALPLPRFKITHQCTALESPQRVLIVIRQADSPVGQTGPMTVTSFRSRAFSDVKSDASSHPVPCPRNRVNK